MGLTIINFGHPISASQRVTVAELAEVPTDDVDVVEVAVHFDHSSTFVDQAAAAVDAVGFDTARWSAGGYVVVLPGHAVIAAVVLAEIDGRSGSLPTIVRFVPGTAPGSWEVAELIDLRHHRNERARRLR